MYTLLSLVTSVKDYIEVVHKLVETDPNGNLTNYYDFGATTTFAILSFKQMIWNVLSFQWLQTLWSLPTLVPDMAASMISEISVLDGSFHNTMTFLEKPLSYGNTNLLFYCMEKFMIGLINSFFLCFPTSIAHIITLRRFVMQGLEAGYISGLGTIAGNLVWIGSMVFGLRFIVIPWLSLDLLRYLLGFILLIKYMWDSYTEKRTVLEDLSKWKIFLLTFLLSFTEQTNLSPFLSNLSIGSDATPFESFPTQTVFEFVSVHGCYLMGIFVGSLSLLQLTCWFWENPAFNIYMWLISSFKVTTSFYHKLFNLIFLYLTMICAVSNMSYFGIDYTITHPLGMVHEDRLIDQKMFLETSFLNSKASDRNTRRNRGRHGRRERWKRRVRRYRTFDASLYDQGVYDLFTIEDLNYGFDRFWLRRKIRNHRVRFRFFPGPWMRSFKKQLSRPRLESFMGPRVEFFRILFEQAYHPEFHEFRHQKDSNLNDPKNTSNNPSSNKELTKENAQLNSLQTLEAFNQKNQTLSSYAETNPSLRGETSTLVEDLHKEQSALRKFVRKVNSRIHLAQISHEIETTSSSPKLIATNSAILSESLKDSTKPIYSKRWKYLFSNMTNSSKTEDQVQKYTKAEDHLFQRFSNNILWKNDKMPSNLQNYFETEANVPSFFKSNNSNGSRELFSQKDDVKKHLNQKDRQILRYKTFLSNQGTTHATEMYRPMTLLHPMKFYLQKDQAFQRKCQFYGVQPFRNFGVENQAPYFRIMMKRFFYYYKPTLRWERTMRVATLRKARRKGPRIGRKLNVAKTTEALAFSGNLLKQNLDGLPNTMSTNISEENMTGQAKELNQSLIQKPTHFYSLVSKRASRYRFQIYKDVLQHWYYTPLNRLLLKMDVDSFIRRQPKTYFLNPKDEKLLHVKRTLLSEYYETLRWYTYMQHARTMKAQIGGTKSLSSRAYNQQFQGTLKKIRHLFAITPSSTDYNVLKFDQPLYNEYANDRNDSIVEDSLVHEELLADESVYMKSFSSTAPQDLPNQSAKILREYLFTSIPLRQELIRKLLSEKNYWELTQFLFKGQKLRGTRPVTNSTDFFNQEHSYLFSPQASIVGSTEVASQTEETINKKELWVSLLKKAQNTLYDQEALKNYVTGRVEKHERQKQRQQKQFKARLERMKQWFVDKKANNVTMTTNGRSSNESGLTSSIQKALKDGLFWEKNWNSPKTNIRNNRPDFYKQLDAETQSSTKFYNFGMFPPSKSLFIKDHFKERMKQNALEIQLAEEDLQNQFSSIQKTISEKSQTSQTQFQSITKQWKKIKYLFLKPVRMIFNKGHHIITSTHNQIVSKSTPFGIKRNVRKDMSFWRQREMALSKRKKVRKTFKRLRNATNRKEQTWVQSRNEPEDFMKFADRKKRDDLFQDQQTLSNSNNPKNWQLFLRSQNPSQSMFVKSFKRKRTRLRRSRRFKARSPIKKSSLGDKFKRQFRLLKRYRQTDNQDSAEFQAKQNRKVDIIQQITKRKYDPQSPFQRNALKQRRTRQRKHRFWKKHKKPKYATNRRKLRHQRRRYALNKMRLLNKKLYRIHGNEQMKKWWWQTFLPNFQANKDFVWQMQKNEQIQQQLSQLSVSDILERDQIFNKPSSSFLVENRNASQSQVDQEKFQTLQIGDKDYKPLAIPEALRIREKLVQKQLLNFGSNATNSISDEKMLSYQKSSLDDVDPMKSQDPIPSNSSDIIGQISQKLFQEAPLANASQQSRTLPGDQTFNENGLKFQNIYEQDSSKFMVGTNPMPFYTGWDETLRQFVVTNRFLSRKDAGYLMNLSIPSSVSSHGSNTTASNGYNSVPKEVQAPLQGMNAATTLYWQIPFTTYDPDQFFALGMDGFSPIAWRNFHFKHSKQTTQPILVKNILSNFNTSSTVDQNRSSLQSDKSSTNAHFQKTQLSYDLQFKMLSSRFKPKKQENREFNPFQIQQYRRIQKRQKRLKKHPRPPVWFPSGPLTNQVLPVHYIYVFYKRSRLPRDRYIRRRLRRTPHVDIDQQSQLGQQLFKTSNYREQASTFDSSYDLSTIKDYTLRKRAKPRRKYHRTRQKLHQDQFFFKRRAFRAIQSNDPTPNNETSPLRFRPLSKIQATSVLSSKRTAFQSKASSSFFEDKRNRDKNAKDKNRSSAKSSENLRVRQLRRRVQRQVIRPISRYKPRAGGFVWPGDYLRLELVKAPKLQTSTDKLSVTEQKMSMTEEKGSNRKIRKKKRRTIQEWQIQPKQYLLQKHNRNVLKKRLEKSQNIAQMHQKIQQFQYLWNQ